jgi:hypothetical protein
MTRLRLPLAFLLALAPGLSPAFPAMAMGPCVDVPVYGGQNAAPLVTSQIYPSTTGDTVVNDLECMPGSGRQVLVGSWEHPESYQPKPGENPCAGEPTMKIAYPVDFGATRCFCWKHWKSRTDLHSNSASDFACGAGSFQYAQWHTDLVCGKSASPPPPGEPKGVYTKKCCQDTPPTIWSQVLNFSGCPAS